MKICSKCGQAKVMTDFFVRDKQSGRLHAQCKRCYATHHKRYYAQHYQQYRPMYLARAKVRREVLREEFRENMLTYLTDKACKICGEADIRVLDFDHLDPSGKQFGISKAVRLGRSWGEVLQEIEKCRILCANCHRKHTANQFGWYKK